jgi:dTDP-4-dehydrorhamnose 3,5-epimerase-like enzyme
MDSVKFITLESHNDRRGKLAVLENLPFRVKRIFCIWGVPKDEVRGGHAHLKCKQFFIAAYGAVMIIIGDGRQYLLDEASEGLYVPERFSVSMRFLTDDACLFVIASEKFDREDYLYGESND